MENNGSNRQTWADKLAEKNAGRITQREEDRAKAQKEKKSSSEAGKDRIHALAELWNKGREAFKSGVKVVKEAGAAVGRGARQSAEFVAGLPEWGQEKVDNIVDGTVEKSVDAAKWMVRADDYIADQLEIGMARLTGFNESKGLGITARLSEAHANYLDWKRKRVNGRAKDGYKLLKAEIAAKQLIIAKLQESLKADQAELKGAVKEDRAEAKTIGREKSGLTEFAQESRAEAKKRKGNGKGLAGTRQIMSTFIRSNDLRKA